MAVFSYLYLNNWAAHKTVSVGYVLSKVLKLETDQMLDFFAKVRHTIRRIPLRRRLVGTGAAGIGICTRRRLIRALSARSLGPNLGHTTFVRDLVRVRDARHLLANSHEYRHEDARIAQVFCHSSR